MAGPPPTATSTTAGAARPLPPIPPPHPGPPRVVTRAPNQAGAVALTVDDGYAPAVVEAYVAFALRTGIHLTFSPNGAFRAIWDRRPSGCGR